MPRQIGERVGAVVCADKDTVTMFGYGTYEGDHVPPPEIIGPFGPVAPRTNPKIKLDSGEIAWGCECWWGPEEVVKSKIGGRTVKTITPTEYREEHKRRVDEAQKG
jgi:hypothetical protein